MEEEKKTRILVVDDEEDLCEILKFNLEAEGYEIDTAYSGKRPWRRMSPASSCFCLTL